ncbi:MAG: DUF11 domain-containing protein [Anaerolineales bacterium]
MKRAMVAVGLVFLVWLAGATTAQAQGLPLYTVGRGDSALATVDPMTGQLSSPVNILLNGMFLFDTTGLARHPQTGQLFATVRPFGQMTDELVTVDPATGVATSIGDTGDVFAAITFDSNGTLWGLTADTATTPATLFTLSTTDATPTLVLALGTEGDAGESLAFSPEDGLLYHASGGGPSVFETIDPTTLMRIPLTVAGPDFLTEPMALAHWRGDFFLLASVTSNSFLLQRTGGSVTVRFLVGLPHSLGASGAVFAGPVPTCPPLGQLYGAAYQTSDGPGLFYLINPTNGAATLVGPIGFEHVSAMDFDPGGTLFATGERMDGSDTNVLLTIDPCTGVGSEVGPTGVDGSAGVDFNNAISDISFRRSDGTLFAYLDPNNGLGTINAATGAASFIGTTNSGGGSGGIAFSSNDSLFHANNVSLSTLNQTTAQETVVAPLGFPPEANFIPRINALDFRGETLFGVLDDGEPGFGAQENYLTTVNTMTGAVTNVGATQGGLDAIAFTSGVADLFLSKADSTDPVIITGTLTYTVTVANAGPEPATGVLLTDTLPMGVNFSSVNTSQGTCAQNMGVVTCDLGMVAAQASATVTIAVSPQNAGVITNMASVTLNEPDPDLVNNSASIDTEVVDFTISVMPASVTVTRGNTAVYMVTLTPVGSRFDSPITLACEMLPSATTCAFVPQGPTPGGGAITTTLNVLTTAPSSAALPPTQAPVYAAWLLAPLGLLILGASRRKSARALFGLLLLFLLLQAACGGGDDTPMAGPTGTPLGTHTFTIRGSVGTLAHTTTADVVVQ